jgi:hypothetical protein
MKASKHLVLCLVGAGLAGCGSSKPTPGVVAENWSTNTEQLGIQAIYPPRAHFEVGDVFIARATSAGQKLRTSDYVLGSIKIDHIDMSEALYRSAPTVTFESTDTYDDGTTNGPVSTRKALPLTVHNRVINSLVAFPGFTFASLAESDVGVNVTSSAIGALFGFGRRSQYSVSYSVPSGETYGVTYLEGRRRFDDVARTRYSVTDRQWMRDAAKALQSTHSKNSDGSGPILVFVTDVYLTRSIDVTVSAQDGMSASFSTLTLSMVELSDKKKSLEDQLAKLRKPAQGQAVAPTPTAAPDSNAGEGAGKVRVADDTVATAGAPAKPEQPKPADKPATPPVTASQQTEIDKVEAELVQVNAQMRQQVDQIAPDLPGVTGSVVRSSALGVKLRQAFAQPVAIGYRGINYSIESLLDSNAAKDSSGTFKTADPRKYPAPLKETYHLDGYPNLDQVAPPAAAPPQH